MIVLVRVRMPMIVIVFVRMPMIVFVRVRHFMTMPFVSLQAQNDHEKAWSNAPVLRLHLFSISRPFRLWRKEFLRRSAPRATEQKLLYLRQFR
jgi:hypothetical protein